MLELAKELLCYYNWACLEGIVALWYCKSENPLINKIIDVMTEWSFHLKYLEETGKVLGKNKHIDMESRMIVDFFEYMINESTTRKPREVVEVFAPYLTEADSTTMRKLYQSINERENELREMYHSDNAAIKQEALDEFLLPAIRFKKEEKEIPMRGLLLTLLKENTSLLD
jgi:hypothetical protein